MSTTNELITLFKSPKEFIPINETGETTPTTNDHKKKRVVNHNEDGTRPLYFLFRFLHLEYSLHMNVTY